LRPAEPLIGVLERLRSRVDTRPGDRPLTADLDQVCRLLREGTLLDGLDPYLASLDPRRNS
jgi:hypothetical protein